MNRRLNQLRHRGASMLFNSFNKCPYFDNRYPTTYSPHKKQRSLLSTSLDSVTSLLTSAATSICLHIKPKSFNSLQSTARPGPHFPSELLSLDWLRTHLLPLQARLHSEEPKSCASPSHLCSISNTGRLHRSQVHLQLG